MINTTQLLINAKQIPIMDMFSTSVLICRTLQERHCSLLLKNIWNETPKKQSKNQIEEEVQRKPPNSCLSKIRFTTSQAEKKKKLALNIARVRVSFFFSQTKACKVLLTDILWGALFGEEIIHRLTLSLTSEEFVISCCLCLQVTMHHEGPKVLSSFVTTWTISAQGSDRNVFFFFFVILQVHTVDTTRSDLLLFYTQHS